MEQNLTPNYEFDLSQFTVYSDIVELPSQGRFYAHGKGQVLVEHMTASDENILTTPNLINTGKQFDVLLERKIKDKDFKVDELLKGDKDAILLFLRKTGYGYEYPVTVTDPRTYDSFEEVVDLNRIENRPLKHLPDAGMFFNFTLPVRNKNVKFRILTEREQVNLQKMIDAKAKIMKNKDNILNTVTERMKSQVVEIDGNNDSLFITKFIETMPVKDSYALRMFMSEVEPDLDLSYEFTNPNTGETFQGFVPYSLRLFYPNFNS